MHPIYQFHPHHNSLCIESKLVLIPTWRTPKDVILQNVPCTSPLSMAFHLYIFFPLCFLCFRETLTTFFSPRCHAGLQSSHVWSPAKRASAAFVPFLDVSFWPFVATYSISLSCFLLLFRNRQAITACFRGEAVFVFDDIDVINCALFSFSPLQDTSGNSCHNFEAHIELEQGYIITGLCEMFRNPHTKSCYSMSSVSRNVHTEKKIAISLPQQTSTEQYTAYKSHNGFTWWNWWITHTRTNARKKKISWYLLTPKMLLDAFFFFSFIFMRIPLEYRITLCSSAYYLSGECRN